MKLLLASAVLITALGASAQEESTTKTKTSDVIPQNQQVGDIDQEITNAKLRAESGSKSRHSASLGLNYNGGTVESPIAYQRPNIVGANATPTLTAISGDVNYRYRMTQNDSLTVGLGLNWVAPSFDLDARHKAKNIKKQEATDPSFGYSRAFKSGDIQNIFSAGVTKYSSAEVIETEKTNYNAGIGHTVMTKIGDTAWEIGAAADLYYYNYYEFLEGAQAEYSVGFYPIAEYAFNDRYNFRTVYRGNSYVSLRENNMAFLQREITQSMGLGISATRDIFLYPNVQWDWRDTRSEKTNVALSATMNFF